MGFIFPTSQHLHLTPAAGPGTVQRSSPVSVALGQDASTVMAWLPRVGLPKGRGADRCLAAAWLPMNRNPLDFELGQRHGPEHAAGLGELWAAPLPPLAGCRDRAASSTRNSLLELRAGGLALLIARCYLSRRTYSSGVVCSWPLLCVPVPF